MQRGELPLNALSWGGREVGDQITPARPGQTPNAQRKDTDVRNADVL